MEVATGLIHQHDIRECKSLRWSACGDSSGDQSAAEWPEAIPQKPVFLQLDQPDAGGMAKSVAEVTWKNLVGIEGVVRKGEIALSQPVPGQELRQSHAARAFDLAEPFKFPESWQVPEVGKIWVRVQQLGHC